MKTRHVVSLAMVAVLGLAAHTASARPPGHHGSLPPGLQKKAQRGQSLPPGWQKKLQRGHILEPDIYRHGVIIRPRDQHGYVTMRIDNEVVRLIAATHEIVDILSR